ncbi:MAG: DUF192 domain-containing protein [Bacteroidales bacterium]|jgi:uncharacterized membrane protein (UPF0127 family)|nr:DUF192 domain-containing protein [Bacteroidales bacterium]
MKKIQIILILLSAVIIIPTACKDKLPRPEIDKPANMVEPEGHNFSFENPPVIKKEGEVKFIRKDADTVISKIDVEIADNDLDRALGLMFRPEMEENHGMLFLFKNEVEQAFWMLNTIISLDILYVNSRGEIVKIYKNTKTESQESLPSGAPAINVIEVNAGYCETYGIKEGDFVDY